MNRKVHDGDRPVTARCAFVAGATGYTGRAVVAALRARGIATVAHVRPDSPRTEEWRRRFGGMGAEVDTSHWTPAAMTAALRRHAPDLVFALLGTTRARGRGARSGGVPESYETVDYGLTAMLLRAMQAAAPHARFVYLSALGAGPRARGAYMQARWRLEEELRASGVEWTIVRPAFVTGPDREERRPAERATSLLLDGLLGAAAAVGGASLRDRYRSLSATTLARGMVRHALDAAAAGRVIRPDELRDG